MCVCKYIYHILVYNVYSRLKNVEDEMEILNVEIEELDITAGQQNKRRTTAETHGSEKEAERKSVLGS